MALSSSNLSGLVSFFFPLLSLTMSFKTGKTLAVSQHPPITEASVEIGSHNYHHLVTVLIGGIICSPTTVRPEQ